MNTLPSARELHFEQRTHCPACGSDDSSVWFECSFDTPRYADFWQHPKVSARSYLLEIKSRTSLPLLLHHCHSCCLLWQPTVLTNSAERELYESNQLAGTAASALTSRSKSYSLSLFNFCNIFQKLFPEKSPKEIQILDFGAGWGNFIDIARVEGFHPDAVEINTTRIMHLSAKKIPVKNLETISACSYHAVLCDNVLEHLSDPKTVIAAIHRMLRQDGYAIFRVPSVNEQRLRAGLIAGEVDAMRSIQPFEHINIFLHNSLPKLLSASGFTVLHCNLKGYALTSARYPRWFLGSAPVSYYFSQLAQLWNRQNSHTVLVQKH